MTPPRGPVGRAPAVRGTALRTLAAGALLGLAAGAAAQESPAPVALVGATLVDGTGSAPVRDGVVIVRDGRLACVGTRAACPRPGRL
jgi:hypothetical protein